MNTTLILVLILLVVGYMYYIGQVPSATGSGSGNGNVNTGTTTGTTTPAAPAGPPTITSANYSSYYSYTPNTDSAGSDIACNVDPDFYTALTKCYADSSCKSVMLSPWNTCRKTSSAPTGTFNGNGTTHGLYVKK